MSSRREVVVNTKSGKVAGDYIDGLYVFKGIPYAAPPVGELRWEGPQPPKPWGGVRAARTFGTIAPQNLREGPPLIPMREVEPQNEDCLFLNVWTPGADRSRRPVMVWIHGGGFSIGSSSQEMYRAGPLVSRGNVVLVTINYRLGVLGFLNLNEITHGRIPATGNEGLLDQVAALEWVKDNIAAFGGDPRNVTIFGESAGGMSVGCLMNMPKAQGLFQRAILESAVGELSRPLDISVKNAALFLKIAGVKPEDPDSLRALSVKQVLAAQLELAVQTGQAIAPAIPVVDGKVLPRPPLESFDAGLASAVPTMAGSNLDEEKLFAAMLPVPRKMDESGLKASLEHFVAARDVPRVLETYQRERLKRGESTSPADLYSAINTDLMFRRVAVRIVEAQCRHNRPAFNYLFTWKSPSFGGILGACHVLEIPFVFGNLDPGFCGEGPEVDRLSLQMQDAWAAFARSGSPSTASLGEWPQYCAEQQTMVFGKDSRVEKSVNKEELRVWDDIGQTDMADMP